MDQRDYFRLFCHVLRVAAVSVLAIILVLPSVIAGLAA